MDINQIKEAIEAQDFDRLTAFRFTQPEFIELKDMYQEKIGFSEAGEGVYAICRFDFPEKPEKVYVWKDPQEPVVEVIVSKPEDDDTMRKTMVEQVFESNPSDTQPILDIISNYGPVEQPILVRQVIEKLVQHWQVNVNKQVVTLKQANDNAAKEQETLEQFKRVMADLESLLK